MSWSDLRGADGAPAAVALPHTTRAEPAACRNIVVVMAAIIILRASPRHIHARHRRRVLRAAVVAAETFSDLRIVATERAPRLFTAGLPRRAFQRAATEGHFDVEAVSPARAAARIHVPALLIHGEADIDTPPDHSRRIFAALNGPKRLILVPGGTHNSALRPEVWREIDQWIDRPLTTPRPSSPSGRAG